MINIEMPKADFILTRKRNPEDTSEAPIAREYGFTDYHKIPRDKAGVFMFYDADDNLLYVGKARKLRMRIRKHFEDNVSDIKNHRDDVHKIVVCIVDSPVERDIYETFIINTFQAKYNTEKVFFNS
ncbi:nucleotide excision repair endonuclease [Domibacillus epiphyticus]|uniref:Nucleotide excision repair endonuclease n=1 Tax=Domibacillus epiphyticus TaxID=1714355 RepID=A0A1V2A7T3_9BACI|nr:nucleotide excision repair endonuclease [Domibacillus epiphyticus]OMP66990.1 nucleotide excision repair endonuclease [Domibacillus epiphyticus]